MTATAPSSSPAPSPRYALRVEDILAPAHVVPDARPSNKRALLHDLARRAGRALDLDPAEILSALLKREALGSTGIGDGLALPHARLEGVRAPFAVLARLRDPLDFDAIDDRPIDLACLLLLPASAHDEHLSALACVARRLRDAATAAALRGARDASGLYAAMIGRGLGSD